MKKYLYLLPFAALAMASCSKSEDVVQTAPAAENQEVKIFPQVGGTTRGTIETTASIASFELIANGKFGTSANDDPASLVAQEYNKTVNKDASGWAFSDATKLYWGDATTSASFTAYANKGAATYSAGKLTGFVVEADPANQTDLIVAYNSGTKTDFSSGVPLHFQHALSQIIVNATYTYDADFSATHENLTVKVKGVKFVNVDGTGALTLPTSSTVSSYAADWALSGTNTASFESSSTTAQQLSTTAALIDNSATAGPMLLLPQSQTATTNLAAATVTGSYLMALVDINKAGDSSDLFPKTGYTTDGGFAWIAVPVNIDWKAGYKYTYTLNFSNTACGKSAPGNTEDSQGKNAGDPIVTEVLTPVTFLVTVESEWTEQSITPAM